MNTRIDKGPWTEIARFLPLTLLLWTWSPPLRAQVTPPPSPCEVPPSPEVTDPQPCSVFPDDESGFYVQPPYGMYTHRDSYAPLDSVKIHANWPLTSSGLRKVQYRVFRVGPNTSPGGPLACSTDEPWTLRHTTAAYTYTATDSYPYGSFVEFAGFSLPASLESSNPSNPSFTLEAWVLPRSLGGDVVCIAGQLGHTGTEYTGTAGIAIDEAGKLTGVALRDGPGATDLIAQSNSPLAVDDDDVWTYVALTLNNGILRLHYAPLGGCLETKQVPQSINQATQHPLATSTGSFRIGARQEAPGDLTGCFDGRVDQVGVWNVRLGVGQLQALMEYGEGADDPDDPCVSGVPGDPNPCSRNCNIPFANRRLWVTFEDAYQFDPVDTSLLVVTGQTSAGPIQGTVRNHGTPGIAGRFDKDFPAARTHAIELAHDQIIDAKFSTLGGATSFTIAQGWKSGMYVIQAVFECPEGNYDPDIPMNSAPENFCAFVVRPNPAAPVPAGYLAVVVPTFTWMAYNSLPGAHGDDACFDCLDCPAFNNTPFGRTTAAGITPRKLTPSEQGLRPQGNNGAYGVRGKRYVGWRRPCYQASPIVRPCPLTEPLAEDDPCKAKPTNWREAPMDARVFQWLHVAERENGQCWSLPYHAFTDSDLHAGRLDLSEYKAVMFLGHAEYWSEAMLSRVHVYMENGGNLVNLGGNALAWRVEFCESTGVLEVKKWSGHDSLPADRMSFIQTATPPLHLVAKDSPDPAVDDNLMGAWRIVLQCQAEIPLDPVHYPTTLGRPLYDYILGTMGDGTSFSGNVGHVDASGIAQTGGFGYWKVESDGGGSPHPLWSTTNPPLVDEKLFDLGRIVGSEFDAYLDPANTPNLHDCPNDGVDCDDASACDFLGDSGGPGTITFVGGPGDPQRLPFVAPGERVHVLATGWFTASDEYPPNGGPGFDYQSITGRFNTLDWLHPAFDLSTPEDIKQAIEAGGDGFGCKYQGIPHDGQCTILTPCNVCPVLFRLTRPQGHGNIVYYKHRGGGRVLNVSSIATCRALRPGVSNRLSTLLTNALWCMGGISCPD